MMTTPKTHAMLFNRRTWLTLFATAPILAESLAAAEATVVAREAWVRVPAPSKDQTALYLELENHSAQNRAVVSAVSDAAEKVELHEMKMEGKMMRMSPVAQIDVPANGKASLKPGGFHLMMFGLKGRPAEGDTIRVTLKLDNGATVPVTATVRQQPVE